MIVYKCDFCDQVRDCVPRQIEQMEYDVCADCWKELISKLKGKGRPKKTQRTTASSPEVLIPELPAPREPEPQFPGKPPEIIAGLKRTN
jgi:hypothetical protein